MIPYTCEHPFCKDDIQCNATGENFFNFKYSNLKQTSQLDACALQIILPVSRSIATAVVIIVVP